MLDGCWCIAESNEHDVLFPFSIAGGNSPFHSSPSAKGMRLYVPLWSNLVNHFAREGQANVLNNNSRDYLSLIVRVLSER